MNGIIREASTQQKKVNKSAKILQSITNFLPCSLYNRKFNVSEQEHNSMSVMTTDAYKLRGLGRGLSNTILDQQLTQRLR